MLGVIADYSSFKPLKMFQTWFALLLTQIRMKVQVKIVQSEFLHNN